MPHTLDLLAKALDMKRASQWCREFNITEGTISQAKRRGRLSPTLAGNFAIKLGEDPAQWIAIAALEAEPESTLLDALKKKSGEWRKR
jgi:hypothetical protein